MTRIPFHSFLALNLILLASHSSQAASDPIPLPHEDSDIPTDPAVTWGHLENGLRFAILPNEEPPDRVSMRLFVDAGSLMEADNQQGLAHFIEHMAFNGTENFPAGEMVEYFQRLGMGFGSHTNAHVSFNETVYKLELPSSEKAMIDEGLKLFRDYADKMKLLPDEIEAERGVILAEKRDRDSVDWRTFVEQMKFAFPEHRISKRMPIGIEEVISNAPRERFVEFYENWYTPNRMAVIVVGDVEVATVEELIRAHFESMPERKKRESPTMGDVSQRVFAAHYHFEEEAGETSVSIEALQSRINPPDNTARRTEDLKRMIAGRNIQRRLERLAKEADSPVKSATMHVGDFFDLGFALYSSIQADCKPEDWEAAIELIEQELRRALEFGFTDAEMAETKAVILRLHEEAAQQMGTRKSRSLADEMARRIGNRRIFTSPIDDLSWVQSSLQSITAEDCKDALVELWSKADETLVMLSGNIEIEDPLASIESAYETSQQVTVTPPEEQEIAKFAYSELPEPGAIAEQNEIEDLEVVQLRFENNVRVNLKETDFEDDTIHVKVRIGSGRLTEPAPGLSLYASSILNKGGLEAHSHDELKRIFAGESVGNSFRIDEDALVFSGQTTPDDLESQLKLMCAYIAHPGYRDEADLEFRKALDQLYQQLEHTPGGFIQNEVARFLRSGDTRFGYPSRSDLEALTISQAKEWLQPQLESGYCEVTLVGSFDPETAIKSLASTFGTLPDRNNKKPDYSKERLVKFPEAGSEKFEFESDIPKAMTAVHWPTTDIYDINTSRRLGMLGAILDDRLRVKIREELGDAYSPFAHNLPSDTWTDYGYLFASVTVSPDQADSVIEAISEIAGELSTGESITEDELERAKKPQVTQIEEMRRTNRYWMGSVLESSQEYPERLQWSRTFVDDYKQITLEEVNSLARQYMDSDSMVSIIVSPKRDEG
ncbi:MAG: insulinase family protein [Verrucomicrobiota bacterium]